MMKMKSKGPYQVTRNLLIGEFVFAAGSAFPGTLNTLYYATRIGINFKVPLACAETLY